MANKGPCKGCEIRHVGCHAICKDYIEWKEELDELNAAIREYAMLDKCAFYRRQRAIDFCRKHGEKIYK